MFKDVSRHKADETPRVTSITYCSRCSQVHLEWAKLMAVDTRLGATLKTSDPTSLFQAPIAVNPVIDQYAVARDGQRFIFCAPGDSTSQPITVVVNWTAGLHDRTMRVRP